MFTTSFVPPLPLRVSVVFFWRPSYTYHVPFSLKKLTAHLKRGWSCCFYQVTKVQPSKLRKLIYGPSLKFDLRTSVPLKKKRCKIGSNTGLLHAVPSCQVSLSLIWNLQPLASINSRELSERHHLWIQSRLVFNLRASCLSTPTCRDYRCATPCPARVRILEKYSLT